MAASAMVPNRPMWMVVPKRGQMPANDIARNRPRTANRTQSLTQTCSTQRARRVAITLRSNASAVARGGGDAAG